jgi:glutathione S-transferase
MSLTLYYHPLSSFCHKVLIALYENGMPFTPLLVDLGNPESRAAFLKVWPIGKFPVLRDERRGETVPESTAIIDYLGLHYPGAEPLIPAEPVAAQQVRLLDRVIDLHLHLSMQKAMGDNLRPADRRDSYGVEQAIRSINTTCGILEREIAGKTWLMGNAFTMADCAAAPALFYSDMVVPLADAYPQTAAYLARLKQRPSYARALEEAQPYMHLVPRQPRVA